MVVPSNPRREQVLKLIDEKDKIEKKISDLGVVLQQNHVAINDALVDAEGFPRNDVDVRTVRIARQQILCLQNDLKDLMKEIEKGLEEIHADGQENLNTTKLAPENRNNGPTASGSRSSSVTNLQNQTPIVIVNLVSQDSPAMEAGILHNDHIISFGTISADNFKDLAQIGDLVRSSQNRNIKIIVKRHNGKMEELLLTPKPWSGRGLLGCNIVPFASTQN